MPGKKSIGSTRTQFHEASRAADSQLHKARRVDFLDLLKTLSSYPGRRSCLYLGIFATVARIVPGRKSRQCGGVARYYIPTYIREA